MLIILVPFVVLCCLFFFFFNDTATTEIYTLSLHDALPILYSDIILGFYADEKLRELKFWQDWIELIHDRKTNQWSYYDDYKGEIIITPINRQGDRKSTRLNSSHALISYAVFCLKKKHTSELQSRTNLVCRLLLEKKKHV